MSDNHSTMPATSGKPAKPYEGFPLFPHASGQWAKKIRGKLHYFGKWDDWRAALDDYDKQKDALHAGRKPRPDADAVTVKEVVNTFLTLKKEKLDAGELSAHTWAKYKTATDEVISALGKTRLVADLDAQDFAKLRKRMAAKWGVYRLGDMIQHVRSLFKHGPDSGSGLLTLPVHFGPGFARPSKKDQRLHRAEQGPKLFTAGEVRQLIDAAGVQQRAMILLGINAGFGNTDCANLPLRAVDLDKGIIDFPRPKTGIPRRCALWPETVAALRESLAKRYEPKNEEDAGLVFITQRGQSFQASEKDRPIAQVMAWLLRRLRINGRKGLGFYTLRHTFRTVADESRDQPAVDFIMGHEVPHMSSVYRETISDDRLRAVAAHVRKWLFPSTAFVENAG
jgi:integrase